MFKITYYRPYLPAPERDEAQHATVDVETVDEVLDIYSECQITHIEEVFSDVWCYDLVDTGLTDDRPYRKGVA